jgi:hypothetical protein
MTSGTRRNGDGRWLRGESNNNGQSGRPLFLPKVQLIVGLMKKHNLTERGPDARQR